MKTLDLEKFRDIDITQRDNHEYKSQSCFPSSAAIAIDFLYPEFKNTISCQTSEYIVQRCMNLTDQEKQEIIKINGSSWMFDDPSFLPFQAIPIEAYVIKKYIYSKVWQMWRCTYDDIIDSIYRGIPVVCLGNFRSLSYVDGHYNCVVGYDKEKNTVITMDPFGNAHRNYRSPDGFAIEYDWSIFIREQNKYGYGLWFK